MLRGRTPATPGGGPDRHADRDVRATRAWRNPRHRHRFHRRGPRRRAPRNEGRGRTPATSSFSSSRSCSIPIAQRGPGPNPGNASPPSTTRTAWPACWTGCGRQARTSRPPRRQLDCRRPACSGSSPSRKAPRISSVPDGRPTAPGRAMGLGRPGLMACSPAAGTGGPGTALSRAPTWRSASQTTLPPDLTTARRAQRGRRNRNLTPDTSSLGRPDQPCEPTAAVSFLAIFGWTGHCAREVEVLPAHLRHLAERCH